MAFNIVILIGVDSPFGFAFGGSPDFELSLFAFIISSPMFCSFGSSGINGFTSGIGFEAIADGIIVGFNVLLKLDRPL